jgi:hypothetical protein
MEFITPEGHRYSGHMRTVNGGVKVKDGQGELHCTNGDRYVGSFRDDMFNG